MIARRVVTGIGPEGASLVRSDGESPRTIQLPSVPEFCGALVWSTEGVPDLSHEVKDRTPRDASFVPGAGGTRLHIMHFPPDSLMESSRRASPSVLAEQQAQMPGLAERFEPDGMHTTDTLDYAIVIAGEIWLELDQGELTRLGPGDVVIQRGTRHAWRNRSDSAATIAFVMVGATR
jgi:hypothetical protein